MKLNQSIPFKRSLLLLKAVINKRSRMELMIRSEETAAIVGSISSLMLLHIRRGRVMARDPLRKIAITISSNDVMNAKTAPVITPGRIKGNVTLKKVFSRFAPKLIAAYSSV
jgi:hypothetical protein